MALGRSRRTGDDNATDNATHPGEPGVGVDLAPPFVAGDEATAWLFSLNRFGIRPGLTRIEGLLADLGHPERDLKTLVVAGTNGKGSTTRILARLLRAAGHKVATYTSPHLLRVHERIQINEHPVDADEFARRVDAIRPFTEKHGASWFETLTALAVQIARDEGVDYLCCETGLGGRLDASNALPAIATLLTTVSVDHERILGGTEAEIAAEKLGLLKAGVPLFTGLAADLRGQAFTAAVTAGSPCFFLDELARWSETTAVGPAAWDLVLRERVFSGLPDVRTEAMRRNVALSLLALAELEQSRGETLLPADPAAALGNLFLPGRYQQVLRNPTWIFDTAHNAEALAVTLGAFAARPCTGRRLVLYGGMQDKAVPGELAALFADCERILGLPVSLPRARTAAVLSALLTSLGQMPGGLPDLWQQGCTVAPDMASGLRAVAQSVRPDDAVLVTGSCFMVAEVLHRLGVSDLEETRNVREAASVLSSLAAGAADQREDGS